MVQTGADSFERYMIFIRNFYSNNTIDTKCPQRSYIIDIKHKIMNI